MISANSNNVVPEVADNIIPKIDNAEQLSNIPLSENLKMVNLKSVKNFKTVPNIKSLKETGLSNLKNNENEEKVNFHNEKKNLFFRKRHLGNTDLNENNYKIYNAPIETHKKVIRNLDIQNPANFFYSKHKAESRKSASKFDLKDKVKKGTNNIFSGVFLNQRAKSNIKKNQMRDFSRDERSMRVRNIFEPNSILHDLNIKADASGEPEFDVFRKPIELKIRIDDNPEVHEIRQEMIPTPAKPLFTVSVDKLREQDGSMGFKISIPEKLLDFNDAIVKKEDNGLLNEDVLAVETPQQNLMGVDSRGCGGASIDSVAKGGGEEAPTERVTLNVNTPFIPVNNMNDVTLSISDATTEFVPLAMYDKKQGQSGNGNGLPSPSEGKPDFKNANQIEGSGCESGTTLESKGM